MMFIMETFMIFPNFIRISFIFMTFRSIDISHCSDCSIFHQPCLLEWLLYTHRTPITSLLHLNLNLTKVNTTGLTIQVCGVLWCFGWTWEKHFHRTAVGWVHVQPGEGNGILNDWRNGWRWRRKVLGAAAGPVGGLADMAKRTGEESLILLWSGGGVSISVISCSTVVAEERGVPKHVPSTAHMHCVAEVTQWGADHVRGEVTFKSTLSWGVGNQALQASELAQVHGFSGYKL